MKVRKGGGEEVPLVQGKEQWLRFAGAAVKRYPMPKVREKERYMKLMLIKEELSHIEGQERRR